VRDLDVKILTETTARLLVEANDQIPPDILAGLRRAAAEEESELGRQTLEHLVHDYEVAAEIGSSSTRKPEVSNLKSE